MRYLMKQKLFSLADHFTIKDDQDRDAFLVDGRVFSLGKQLSFQDLAGNELMFIKQRVLSFAKTYELYRGEALYATVTKELFTFFNCRFEIDVPGPGDLEASGDLTDHEYVFTRGAETVATVSKRWFEWSDTYGVEIDDREDQILILASTVVIDMACHERHGR